MATVPSS
nr:TPA_asm: m95.5 sORF [Murid betaherpesvirus 1]DBA08040.1 TPA_asm: m95.5 sORF [Murid betaherpesvirus 1]